MQNLDNLKVLAENLPDELKANALALIEEMGAVIEGVGDDPVTWKPPFLRLVQGTTDRSAIPKGTAIGDFVMGEVKVEQPLKFIPIRIWDARQYWDPDQTNSRMLCWSPDAKFGAIGQNCKACPHAVWREEGGSDCGKIKAILAITADLTKVFTVNFSKSGFKVGMELESLMKKAGVSPYKRTYGLKSETSSTAKNVEVFKIEVLDEKSRKTPDALVPFLEALFSAVSSDRKEMIDHFYENAKLRAEQLVSLAPATEEPVADNTSTLQIAEEVTDVTPKSVSPLAKSYSV
jgi:hypothetical protein